MKAERDLVMKGGITTGVIYPNIVEKRSAADTFRYPRASACAWSADAAANASTT